MIQTKDGSDSWCFFQETRMTGNEHRNENMKEDEDMKLSYKIDDNPPWHLALLLGFQVIIFN